MAYRRYCIIFLASILFEVAVAGRGKSVAVDDEHTPLLSHDDEETTEGSSSHGLANLRSQFVESAKLRGVRIKDFMAGHAPLTMAVAASSKIEDLSNPVCVIVPIRYAQSTEAPSNQEYATFVTTAECANTISNLKQAKATAFSDARKFAIGLGRCIAAEKYNKRLGETCDSNVGIVNVRVEGSRKAAKIHAKGVQLPLLTEEDKETLKKATRINVVLDYWHDTEYQPAALIVPLQECFPTYEAYYYKNLGLLDDEALCIKTHEDTYLRKGAACYHRISGRYVLLGLYSHPGKSRRGYHFFVNLPYHEQLIQQLITQ